MEHANILLITIVFVACHLASPLALRIRDRSREKASSFAAGFAIGYVCLYLLPELDVGHELLGPRIYGVLLVGFSLFYGLEVWILRQQSDHEREAAGHYGVHMAMVMVYNTLMVFAMALEPAHNFTLTVVYALAIGLHLTTIDVGLQEKYGARFASHGRYYLVAAVLAGYALAWLRRPEEAAIDIITATLAGAMMLNVFRAELPELKDARFRYFLVGAALFTVLHVLLAREMVE